MKNKEPLYIVRGTGYGIDGSIVKKVGQHVVGGEIYFLVNPANSRPTGHNSILVHKKYLQELGKDRLNTYTYTITVSKRNDNDGSIEQDLIVIDGAYRNLSPSAILNRFGQELIPILRLE